MTIIRLPHKDHDILIHRKPNARAKRLSLRLARQENTFVLTVPPLATERAIKSFLTRCTPWIEKNLEKSLTQSRLLLEKKLFFMEHLSTV